MESEPWIKSWLASVDPVLGIYASKFDEFGYENENIVSQQTKEELEADLAEMSVKRAHGRMILKVHAELQQKVAGMRAAPGPAKSSSCMSREGIMLQGLAPYMAEAADFLQKLGKYMSRTCLLMTAGAVSAKQTMRCPAEERHSS